MQKCKVIVRKLSSTSFTLEVDNVKEAETRAFIILQNRPIGPWKDQGYLVEIQAKSAENGDWIKSVFGIGVQFFTTHALNTIFSTRPKALLKDE